MPGYYDHEFTEDEIDELMPDELVEEMPDGSSVPHRAEEDSENVSDGFDPMARALSWANEIAARPLKDEQAIELAKVYALIGLAQIVARLLPVEP